MRADDHEHEKAKKKLLELGPAKYEQELNRSAHQGNSDIRAGRAAVAEHRETQAATRHSDLMEQGQKMLDRQDTANKTQCRVLAVLILTVVVTIWLD